MGEIGRAMLKVGLVSEEQLQKVERKAAEKIVSRWREKHGSNVCSMILFKATLSLKGLAGIKEMLED